MVDTSILFAYGPRMTEGLVEFSAFQHVARETCQFSPDALVDPLVGLAGEMGSVFTAYKRYRRDGIDVTAIRTSLSQELGDLLWYVAAVATACDLDLDTIAVENLQRAQDRYGAKILPPAQDLARFDSGFPITERFPRRLVVKFTQYPMKRGRAVASMTLIEATPNAFPDGLQSTASDKVIGYQVGAKLGDHLTDNSRSSDAYRFHDAIHLAFMAVLGWSPTMRALLRVKRKSDLETDEVEDGARAIFAEEGLAVALSRLASRRFGFMSVRAIDGETLDVVRALTSATEVEGLPSWLWAQAISQGFQAMRQLDHNREGFLIADLDARCLLYEKTYQPTLVNQQISRRMVPADDPEAFRAAVRQLHAVKDAAYRNAWKKRGETIGVLANIARKLDRLEAALTGAPALPDESLMDTVVDLLIYSLKYQTYLADLSTEIAAKLFANIPGPYSDGTSGFELLLDQIDLHSLQHGTENVQETAERAQSYFARLEGCFTTLEIDHPVSTRASLAMELTNATVSVIAALKRYSPALFVSFVKGNRNAR
jgi:NTP pyrophosphatase (non-canonical NTP hydrolase)